MNVRAVVAVLCTGACIGSLWAAAQTPQQIVDGRIAGMKAMAGNIKAVAQAIEPSAARAKLAEAMTFAQSIVGRFPKGTGIGDPGVGETRALQEIWNKPEQFKTDADALVKALRGVDAALGGDKGKLDLAFSAVAPSCGGCHKSFRGPETP